MSTMAFIDSMFSNQNQNNALINYLLQQQNAQSTLGSPGMNALLGTSLAESGSDVLLKLLATTNVSAPDYLNSMSLTSQSMLHPQTTLTMPSYLGVNPGGLFSPAAVCNALLFPHRSKRIRTAFTPAQLNKLEIQFNKSPYVVGNQRRQISEELGLTETQVKVWFQNRRTKEKRGVNPGDQDDPVSSEEETDNSQETEHARKFCGSTDGGPDCISKLINSSKPDLKPENCEISRKVSINSSHLPCKKNRSEDKDKHNPVKHFKKLASQGTS